jgi:hypothetical protein
LKGNQFPQSRSISLIKTVLKKSGKAQDEIWLEDAENDLRDLKMKRMKAAGK